MRLTTLALLVCSGTAALCQSTVPAPGAAEASYRRFTVSSAGAASTTARAAANLESIFLAPLAHADPRPRPMLLANNNLQRWQIPASQGPRAGAGPIPTQWPHLQVEPIPATWPALRLLLVKNGAAPAANAPAQ